MPWHFNLSGALEYPPLIKGGKEYIYKSVDGIDLKIWVFSPKEAENKTLPAMLFFFGGGWNGGSPLSFVR